MTASWTAFSAVARCCCCQSPTRGRLATAETQTPKPSELDGEPFEVARAAVEGVATQLRAVIEQLDDVERQVRNARMTDAVTLGTLGLAEHYPEAVTPSGLLPSGADPAEEPYEFWTLTEEAALIRRLAGALRTAAELVERVEAKQPLAA